MRKLIFYLILCMLFILAGCGNGNKDGREPGITGYVMAKEGEKILVVSTEAEDYSENGGVAEFYDAVWARKSPPHVKTGEKVKIWFDGEMEESYPGQTTVSKLEVLPGSTPEGAKLSDTEALNKALSNNRLDNGILTVKALTYNAGIGEWSINLKNTESYEEQIIKVDDK